MIRRAEASDLARRLCAALFNGGEIEHVRAHRITSPFIVAAHEHTALFQFDWIVNCRGGVALSRRPTRLAGGCTLVLVSPGQPHAMALEAAGDDARVYHTRIRPPASARRELCGVSRVITKLPAIPALESALADVWRLTVGAAGRPLLRQVRLAEAIALWPGIADGAAESAKRAMSATGLDRDLDAALVLMERSLFLPPTLDALADAAHLSVRHFTRRFRIAFGIAPKAFLDRKRLALAQQILAYEASGVGEVAERMGFSSVAVFSRWFRHLAGESPSAYRSRPHAM